MTTCHKIEGYYFNNGRAVATGKLFYIFIIFEYYSSEITYFECCVFFTPLLQFIYGLSELIGRK